MITIFERQTLTFENVDVGMWACELEGNPFKIADGINYVIEFDGTQYHLTSFKMQVPDSNVIAVGNGAIFGEEYAQDVPFLFACDEEQNATAVGAFMDGETHDIAVYQQKTIVENKEITFTKDDTDTTAYSEEEGNAFQLQDGMSYIVQFDDVEYTLTSFIFSQSESVNYICLGNGSFVGLEQTTESPFLIFFAPAEIVGNETGATAILTTLEGTMHTISIYRDDGTGAGEPEEPQGIILRNYHGENVIHEGIETLSVDNTDGDISVFTRGIAVHDVPISLDFSSGDQTITAEDGYLVKSAIIKKPETLVEENIADGINIGGIIGTHQGGGGSAMNIVQKSGSYTATASGANTITHDLGILPDIIYIMNRNGYSASNDLAFVVATCKELAAGATTENSTIWANSNSLYGIGSHADIYAQKDETAGLVCRATTKTFQVGGNYCKFQIGEDYEWVAIGGIIGRKIINVKLSIDGDGNLIISGGVPEIEQFNIYVDGTLSKTVDYVYSANDFVVDISDIANEAKEYTISVDGVGTAISEKYQVAIYEPVTGYTVPIMQGSCGTSVNYKLGGDGTLEIYGTGAMDDYSGASGQPWYSNASKIKSVIVKEGVTRIGSQSLRQLTNMTNVTIADSVTSYGTSAFLGSTALSEITISANVTAINAYAFNECTGLKNAYYEGTLEQWCEIKFGGTGANPCYVGNATLYIDGEKLVNVVIPESITTINAYTFNGVKTMTSVTLHDNITKIGEYAFAGSYITSIIIPDKVTQVLWRAFQNCTKLSSVTIGSAVNLIGDNTFYGCSALTSATFKDTTTWIRNSSQTSTTGTTISSSSLANTSTAATYLRSTYVSYWWHKK